MNARAKLLNGEYRQIPLKITDADGVIKITPDISDYSDIKHIDLLYDYANSPADNNGYYVLPRGSTTEDDHLCYFKPREDCEKSGQDFLMPMYGFVKGEQAWLGIVTGYAYEYNLIVGIKDGTYYMYPRFTLDGEAPYEEISVEIRKLGKQDADYSGVCRAYRNYMLTVGGCKSIKDRLNPELKYASESLYIRIRLAWKPAPAKVTEQTNENEPALHVAATFKEVSDFMDKLKAAGVEKAEFCLVGWNISGHDGRYPQMFPVEPKLGGEEELKKLIKHSQELGYQITCHTNCTDSYSIADNFTMDFVRYNKDGSVSCHPVLWSGGLARQICPSYAMELTKEPLLRLRELGFRGLHYIDVLSTLPLPACYCDKHPVTKVQSKKYFAEAAQFAKDLFGGFSSEGGYDFLAKELDYALYTSFYLFPEPPELLLFDERVPLWQIVYHGIILSSPYTDTFNVQVKSRTHQLEIIERGARPTTYVYNKFVDKPEKRWEEFDNDVRIGNPVQEAHAVKQLADQYNEFLTMVDLQKEFIEQHEVISEGVRKITYSNGTVITVDYNSGEYKIER